MNSETDSAAPVNVHPPAGPPRPCAPRALAGLALLLALLLPPLFWRAARPAALGATEVRSLMLTQQGWGKLLGTAPLLMDQFPAGYPCLLKVWNKLGKVLRLPQGAAWSRLPGLLAWAAMAGAAWVLGRRLLGRGGGALLAWSLALGAPGALAARTLGGEALAGPALLTALLALLAIRQSPARPAARFWLLYAACAILALWTDRLAWPPLAVVFTLWLFLSLCSLIRIRHNPGAPSAIHDPDGTSSRQPPGPGLFFGGLLAHLSILLAAAPLPFLLPAGARALAGLRRGWLDFSGTWSLTRALLVGHSTGLRPYFLLPPEWAGWLTLLGGAALLLPAGLLLYRLLFYRSPPLDEAGRGARTLALAGLGTAALGFGLTCALQRTSAGAALLAWPESVYPAWTAWGAGVAGLALWSARRLGWRDRWAWIPLLPWLAAALAGQAVELRHELRSGAALRREIAAAGLLDAAKPLFVMPSELSPYLRGLFGTTPLQPLTELVEIKAGQNDATLLNMNPWPLLDFERDTRVAAQAGAGALSRTVTHAPLPAGEGIELFRLGGVRAD